MLYLVKLIYYWFIPPGLFILLALIMAFLFRKTTTHKYLLLLPAVLLFLASIRPVADALIHPLEHAYPQPAIANISKVDAIVILGGGSVGGVNDFDGVGQLPGGSANRLLAGLRLHKALDKAPIIISGGTVFAHSGSEADISYRVLKACGVKEKYIIKEDKSRNTVENARYTNFICKERKFKRVLLVTSAFHLPRSVEIFKRETDLVIVPYPTDYRSDLDTVYDVFAFVPGVWDLESVSLSLKECLGILALKLNLQ